MYNLTIIREPNEYDGDTTYGEVLVFQSAEQSEIERELKDYLREHLYLYRTDANCHYGDIMFIVTHNGVVIEYVNMTNAMDFLKLFGKIPYIVEIVKIYDAPRNKYDIENMLIDARRLIEERILELRRLQ